ncbi:MAG: hypothetical protein LBQ44_05085 [Treponema sp.]|jgi:Tfp pilus assembly protein PilF|nr:hypothetical protein [Treponema sp.]
MVPENEERPASRGVADEIRHQTELGNPQSLAAAVELIQARHLENTDYGRVMNAAAAALLKVIYPDTAVRVFPPDPPRTHNYTKIIRDAEQGIYTVPAANSRDFLEFVLPFLAYYRIEENRSPDQGDSRLLNTLSDLNKAAQLNPQSVLPYLFQGFVYERNRDLARAETSYTLALVSAPSCYPAELGLLRLLRAQGRSAEENALFSELLIRYPDNPALKKQLARNYVNAGELVRAEGAVAEILQRNPRDGEFLLLRAYIALEQGLYQEAQTPLDSYASIDPGNRDYLFFRARLQLEAYHNRDTALNYLRSIVRSYPNDTEALIYMAGLLMESSKAQETDEGRAILKRLLGAGNPPAELLFLAVQDALRREDWKEGKTLLDRLLTLRRNEKDLLAAYRVERGVGNNAAALSHARELYNRDSGNDETIAAYINALIETGRQAEAGRLIEQRLAALDGGILKGRYYFLRSRLRNNEDAAMNDLRASLFEDPKNLDALIAMFEIYHRRRDTRRAAYYFRQAAALAPNNPVLKRYEAEYR